MLQLTPDESRVLGVLIEKALTTPDQYPLSLNAIVNGSNQKNNRDPVLTMTEDDCFVGVEGLRGKGLAIRVDTAGSRVHKYRHQAIETLRVRTGEAAVLAELLLRGPQTLGELRGRASRMVPMESIETVKELLRALSAREEPMVKEIPPSPGSRAERWMQLLCPELHALESPGESPSTLSTRPSEPGLGDRVTQLESEVARLRDIIRKLAASLGEADPFAQGPSA